MEDSVIIKNNNYEIRGILHLSQDKQVQLEDKNDGMYDIPESK